MPQAFEEGRPRVPGMADTELLAAARAIAAEWDAKQPFEDAETIPPDGPIQFDEVLHPALGLHPWNLFAPHERDIQVEADRALVLDWRDVTPNYNQAGVLTNVIGTWFEVRDELPFATGNWAIWRDKLNGLITEVSESGHAGPNINSYAPRAIMDALGPPWWASAFRPFRERKQSSYPSYPDRVRYRPGMGINRTFVEFLTEEGYISEGGVHLGYPLAPDSFISDFPLKIFVEVKNAQDEWESEPIVVNYHGLTPGYSPHDDPDDNFGRSNEPRLYQDWYTSAIAVERRFGGWAETIDAMWTEFQRGTQFPHKGD